jgi:outer membrane protein OmpA-like peptidoglycan-associated protein
MIVALAIVLTGCSTAERVVLLADDTGKVGELTVSGASETVVLNKANAIATTNALGGQSAGQATSEDISSSFADTLAAVPKPPVAYRIYFQFGSLEFTEESVNTVAKALVDAAERPGADIQLVGHTDTVGKGPDNDTLSYARANLVRERLVERGVDPTLILVAGRGERELLIATPDETREAKNRRVEMYVR